jgi:hypothetical protein
VKDTKNFKAGFLNKKGGSFKSWHKRFFILKGDILLYFKDDTDLYHPLAIVYLHKGIINRTPLYAKKNHTFLVNTQGRRYHFQAGNDEERAEWCDILESCIKSLSVRDTDVIGDLCKQVEKEKMKIVSLSKNIEISLKPLKDLKLDIKKLQFAVSSVDHATRERKRGVTLRHDYLDDSALLNNAQDRMKKTKEEALYMSEIVTETEKIYLKEKEHISKSSLTRKSFDKVLQRLEALKADKNEIQVLVIKMQEDFIKSVHIILRQFDKLERDQTERSKVQRSQSVMVKKQMEQQNVDQEKENLKQQVAEAKERVVKNREELKTLNEHKAVLVKELKKRQTQTK